MVEKVISNDYDISETFNKLFANIVPNLKIIPSQNFETSIQYETENLVKNTTHKFKNLPSIKMIISKLSPNRIFPFCPVSVNEFLKYIKNLDSEKAIQQNYIPTKLLK